MTTNKINEKCECGTEQRKDFLWIYLVDIYNNIYNVNMCVYYMYFFICVAPARE